MPTPKMTEAQMQARIEELEREKAELEARNRAGYRLRLKIGEKGGVSLYGLGRFPVTLYKEQWVVLFGHQAEIEQFIKDNDHLLKSKAQSMAEKAAAPAPASSAPAMQPPPKGAAQNPAELYKQVMGHKE